MGASSPTSTWLVWVIQQTDLHPLRDQATGHTGANTVRLPDEIVSRATRRSFHRSFRTYTQNRLFADEEDWDDRYRGDVL